jgi:hypothetical protein
VRPVLTAYGAQPGGGIPYRPLGLSGLAAARAGRYLKSDWLRGVAIGGMGQRESPERDPAPAKRGSYDRWTTDREKSMGALVRRTAQLGEVVEAVFDKAAPGPRWPSLFAEDLW